MSLPINTHLMTGCNLQIYAANLLRIRSVCIKNRKIYIFSKAPNTQQICCTSRIMTTQIKGMFSGMLFEKTPPISTQIGGHLWDFWRVVEAAAF